MAGAYRMALSRATVELRSPDGTLQDTLTNVTATVRDGVARARTGSRQVAEMPAEQLVRDGKRAFIVTGTDGATWVVTKPCNCGSR
jgi:hypothetical protein